MFIHIIIPTKATEMTSATTNGTVMLSFDPLIDVLIVDVI